MSISSHPVTRALAGLLCVGLVVVQTRETWLALHGQSQQWGSLVLAPLLVCFCVWIAYSNARYVLRGEWRGKP